MRLDRPRLSRQLYYTLAHDPAQDQLAGVYHHLGIGQNFEVIFTRMR